MRGPVFVLFIAAVASCSSATITQTRKNMGFEGIAEILPEIKIESGSGFTNKRHLDVTVLTDHSFYDEIKFGMTQPASTGLRASAGTCDFGSWQGQGSNPYQIHLPESLSDGAIEICVILRDNKLRESQLQRQFIVLDSQAPASLITKDGANNPNLSVKIADNDSPFFTLMSPLGEDTSGIKFIEVSILSPQTNLCLNADMSDFNAACPHWHLAEIAITDKEWSLKVPSSIFGASLDYPVSLRGSDNAGNFLQEDSVAVLDGASIGKFPPIVQEAIVMASLAEDSQVTFNLNYSDENGDLADTCEVTEPENIQTISACQCSQTGECSVVLAGSADYSGSASFQYRVQTKGTWSNAGLASLEIIPVNDAPSLGTLSEQTINEDNSTGPLALNLADIDSSISCAELSVQSTNTELVPTANVIFSGSAPNCQVSVSPTANKFGVANLTMTAFDGALSATSLLQLTVTGVDDAPIAEDLAPSAFAEDSPATISLVYADAENHSANSCAVSSPTNIDVVTGCTCSLGVCSVEVQGTANYFGSASFTYTVTANGLTSAAATASLTISDVADFLIYGSGLDGAATVNSAVDLSSASLGASLDRNGTFADGFALRVSNISGAIITTSHSGIGAFIAGDRVLLINLQGSSSDYVDVGNYEMLTVSAVTATTITLTGAPSLSYDGALGSYADQVVAIQRVPEYGSVTISGTGSITTSAWDRLVAVPSGNAGMRTGIVAFAVSGTLSIQAGGKVHANGLGYQGTLAISSGESIRQSIAYAPALSTANIGGGGQNNYVGPTCWNNGNFGGGGGGGHGTVGTTPSVATSNVLYLNGAGGESYGESDLSQMFHGSSGGQCYAPYCGSPHTLPGSGGGIVFISAQILNNAGSIESLGANATNLNDCCGGTKSGGPGGGAGGSIKIVAAQTSVGTLLATGGTGGKGPTRSIWACGEGAENTRGGLGAVGIIAIKSPTVTDISDTPDAFIEP